MSLRVLAVADDLTGAHDCAARFASVASPVPVARRVEDLVQGAGTRAMVLDVESRYLESSEARRRVMNAWAGLDRRFSAGLRFQKIDSTLRGNVGPELEGMLAAGSAPWVAVLPAYPRAGRQTLAGRHLVHGRPLLRTEFARDPLNPARVGRPQDLFQKHLSFHVPLAWVRKGSVPLAKALKAVLGARKARFVSFDCMEDAHVDSIVRASLKAGCRHFGGASALAGSLMHSGRAPKAAAPGLPGDLRWLIVAGSVSEANLGQLAYARDRGFLTWVSLNEPASRSRLKRIFGAKSLALSTLRSRADISRSARIEGPRAIQALVRTAAVLKSEAPAILLTGGHTALEYFERNRIRGLNVVGEILPGLALGIHVENGKRTWFATKPGGFGAATLLAELHTGGRTA